MEKSPFSLCLLSNKIFDFMATQLSLTGMDLDVFDPHSHVSSSVVVVRPEHRDRGWLVSFPMMGAAACAGGRNPCSVNL